MARFVPEISVIVPLYNAEKYIAECLESLLAQTFKNFEVIVVNDCSTDSSPTIVESYRERFGGRLTLSHMETNTGSGALPRNKGLTLSRGEYLFFVDNDDLITPTALEELCTLAEDFDADIVHCERYFEANENLSEVRVKSQDNVKFFVDKPTFESENLAERVQVLTEGKYWVPPWCKLVRRNLAIEHGIKFPPVSICDDDVWTYALFFYAKKILRVPNVVYIYRQTEDSVMRAEKTIKQHMTFWLNPILFGMQTLEELLGKHEFFRQNPQYLYQMLDAFIDRSNPPLLSASSNLPPFAVYELTKQEFGDKLGDQAVLISMLYAKLNALQKLNTQNVQSFNEFAEQAQKRIAQLEAELKRLRS